MYISPPKTNTGPVNEEEKLFMNFYHLALMNKLI